LPRQVLEVRRGEDQQQIGAVPQLAREVALDLGEGRL
jgi:hypothetical protein